jgi:1-acyl-sn-glycerol-3-phosphate acyltransferase
MLFALRILLLCLHCTLASVIGLLLALCRPFNPDNSRLCAKIYAKPALWILGLKVDCDSQTLRESPQPCVFIANHQSNLDLFVIGGIVPRRTVSVGKKSLKWIPLFGQIYWLAGNILIDRGNGRQARQALQHVSDILRQGDTSIWVFPEGTRNHGRGLLPFKKGAVQMAISAGVPIVPVCVSSYIAGMQPNRWQAGTARIRCLPPIPTAGLTHADIPALLARCQAEMAATIAALDESGTALPGTAEEPIVS